MLNNKYLIINILFNASALGIRYSWLRVSDTVKEEYQIPFFYVSLATLDSPFKRKMKKSAFWV